MLLSKLRSLGAVGLLAFVTAAVGLTYRTAGAQTGRPPIPAAARVTADDLEELRLEVAALRHGLQATRERVKALEAEVESVKGRTVQSRAVPLAEKLDKSIIAEYYRQRADTLRQVRSRPLDPWAEVDKALEMLKVHPNDAKAVDALTRAVMRARESVQQGSGKDARPPK
jgi:hypothetical protein